MPPRLPSGIVAERFADDERMEATVERIADGFASGGMDDHEALAELPGLVREFEDRGPICAAHEEAMPAPEGLGCDLCVRGVDTDVEAERAVDADVRGALNLATEPDLLDAARDAGIDPLRFDPGYGNRRERLERRFRGRDGAPRVCYHEGAFGREPITDVLGGSAVGAAERAAELAAVATER